MKIWHLSLVLSVGLILSACADSGTGVVASGGAACKPLGYSKPQLMDFKSSKFALDNRTTRQDMAIALVDCLSDPNPDIRDGIAYAALTQWMRDGDLERNSVIALKQTLLSKLRAPDTRGGYGHPFAALVLSEVARVDRLKPYMSPEERSDFVKAASDYVTAITDYRGFDDRQGWRHGIAHGSDWLMQLALNERVSESDLRRIRDAVGSQVRAGSSHSYIHGEAARLARPILFLARRGVFTEAEWSTWLSEIGAPKPLSDWSEAFESEQGLSYRHNVKAFLQALYLNATLSQDDNTRRLISGTRNALKTIP